MAEPSSVHAFLLAQCRDSNNRVGDMHPYQTRKRGELTNLIQLDSLIISAQLSEEGLCGAAVWTP
jgi:hypothetical protein